MPSSLRRPLAAIATCVLLVGCSGDLLGDDSDSSTDAAADGDATAGDGTSQRPGATGCGDASRPCDPSAVSPAAAERVDELYAELDEILADGGDTTDALELLQAQSDVLDADAGPDAVRFHVDGAIPTWLFLETALTVGGPPPVLGSAAAPLTVADAGQPLAAPSSELVLDADRRFAVQLSPFDWEWTYNGLDSGLDRITRTIDRVRDYDGRVTNYANRLDGTTITRGVPFTAWQSLDQFDLVHLFAHGSHVCADDLLPLDPEGCDDRRVGIATLRTPAELAAAYSPDGGAGDNPSEAVLRSGGFETGRIGITPRRGETTPEEFPNTAGDTITFAPREKMPGKWAAGSFVVLTADYFRAAYPQGLTDSVVLLTSCSAGGDSDVQQALAGDGTAVFGWTRTLGARVGIETSVRLFELLVERDEDGNDSGGLRAQVALDRLVEEVEAGTSSTGAVVRGGELVDERYGAILRITGEEDARARDVPYLLDDEDDELRDGRAVSVAGQPGDGEPDRLELTIEVDGLADDVDAAALPLVVQVDDEEFTVTTPLSREDGRGRWRTTTDLELGRDLSPTERVRLRVEVELPEGGDSDWTYDDLRVCGTTPDGNAIPFPLPDGSTYVGPLAQLGSVHQYLVPSYDAARAHLESEIARSSDHTQIDDPGISTVGDLRNDGFTLVGPCYDLGGGFSLQEREDGRITLDVLDLG